MIFALSEGLRTRLEARGFPIKVDVGPEFPGLGGVSRAWHRVHVYRDTQRGDAVEEPTGAKHNPRNRMTRACGYVIRVYAAEPSAGATAWEHEREMDQVVDGVLCALHAWVRDPDQGATRVEFLASRMLSSDEVQGSEMSPVVCYELSIRVGRSVNEVDYDGSGLPTGDVTDFQTTVAVVDAAGDSEDL